MKKENTRRTWNWTKFQLDKLNKIQEVLKQKQIEQGIYEFNI